MASRADALLIQDQLCSVEHGVRPILFTLYMYRSHSTAVYRNVSYTIADRQRTVVYHTTSSACH